MKRFIEGEDRTQVTLLPECLDDYLEPENPVRVVEAFVEQLDLRQMGFEGVDPLPTGRPAYHPAVLLKIYIYGYLNRVQSSRRLEHEAQRNVELMWLTGRLRPDFKTIANFRRDNGLAIRKVCRQFIVLCRQLNLFTQALVAIDGSKFKAVNNRDKNFTTAKMQRRLAQIEESIARYLVAMDTADRAEPEIAELKKGHLRDMTQFWGKLFGINAAFTVFGFPDQAAEKTHFAIKIPWLTGLIATRSVDTPIIGIKDLKREHEKRVRNGMKAYAALQRLKAGDKSAEVRDDFQRLKPDLGYGLLLKKYTTRIVDATPEQFQLAVNDTIPNVAPIFWSFRIMVGLGVWFLFVFAAAFIVLARRRLAVNRWVLKLALWSIPLPWIAIELGWIVAEYGRQPWTISEILPTYLSVSSVTIGEIWFSLGGFIAFCTALLVVEMILMFKYARLGPSSLGTGRYHGESLSRPTTLQGTA